MSSVRQLPARDSERWSHCVVNCLKLDINTDGCQLSGLEVKCLHTRSRILGPVPVCGVGCALMKNPILERSGRPMLPGF